MGRLFDYVQVIKHNRFIKTGEPLWAWPAQFATV